MAIIAVGSLAFDGIKTIYGERDKILGGSLTHFSNAASFLSKPKLVGVVGNDFGKSEWDFLKSKSSSTEGVVTLSDEKSFFWQGYYTEDFDTAHTVKTELNAFAKFSPTVPESYKKESSILFLANIDPVIQRQTALLCDNCKIKILDTMNYWIESHLDNLKAAFNAVNGIVINEGEAFLLTGEKNILNAVDKLFLPHFNLIIVKKGSNGVMVFGKDYVVTLPAYPIKKIYDPTGAGDSFAGAFVSYLDKEGVSELDQKTAKAAASYATVVASFCVEGFGVEGIGKASYDDVKKRLAEFKAMASF